jgi:predicted O-methyltransferase YrrM
MLTKPATVQKGSPETLIENLVQHLSQYLPTQGGIQWDEYARLKEVIENNYLVPMTACTPIMARFLFALGEALRPQHIVGLGTFVGYCASWLIGLPRADKRLTLTELVDIDSAANEMARANCSHLRYGDRLRVIDSSAESFIDSLFEPVDALFIDVDDPLRGKHHYTDLLEQISPKLAPGAVVVAHDSLVPRFKEDFKRFHNYVETSELYDGPWVLPIDAYGLSLAVRRA